MPNKNGLILLTPTSVAKTGTGSTATINTNGSVTFSSCVTLSLNGVFSADYDNYMIVCRHQGSISDDGLVMYLRTGGTDASTGYTNQYVAGNGTTIDAARITTYGYARVTSATSTLRSGFIENVYGPYLTQPTAFRSVTVDGVNDARIADWVATHSTSTAYDSFTLSAPSSTFTGLLSVYGLRK